MRIGIFGGCFNPPHKKHKEMALYLIKNNILDKVIYVPTGDYYAKKDLISFKDRYNMLKIMRNNKKNIEVSDLAQDCTFQYTYDVLNYFDEKYKNSQIYFICGIDNLLEFNTWKNYKEILKRFKLIVIGRDNISLNNIDKEIVSDVMFLDIFRKPISSTEVRSELKEFKTTNKVDKKVLKYIKNNNLYI